MSEKDFSFLPFETTHDSVDAYVHIICDRCMIYAPRALYKLCRSRPLSGWLTDTDFREEKGAKSSFLLNIIVWRKPENAFGEETRKSRRTT